MRYTYQFIETGEIFEIEQSMKDAPFLSWPHPVSRICKPVRRVVTGGAGTIFVGDDWADKKPREKKKSDEQ